MARRRAERPWNRGALAALCMGAIAVAACVGPVVLTPAQVPAALQGVTVAFDGPVQGTVPPECTAGVPAFRNATVASFQQAGIRVVESRNATLLLHEYYEVSCNGSAEVSGTWSLAAWQGGKFVGKSARFGEFNGVTLPNEGNGLVLGLIEAQTVIDHFANGAAGAAQK